MTTNDEPYWKKECREKGGTPGYASNGGAYCTLPSGAGAGVDNVPIGMNPTRPPLHRFSLQAAASATWDEYTRPGGYQDKLDGVLDDMLPDVPSLGLPKIVVVLIALVALYAMGVQAGLVPPLRKVFK